MDKQQQRHKDRRYCTWQVENVPGQEPYLKSGGTNKPLDTTACRIPSHSSHTFKMFLEASSWKPAHHKMQRLVQSYLGGGGTPLGTLKHRPATQENQFSKTCSQTHFMKQHRSTAVTIMLGFQLYWQAVTEVPKWHCTSLTKTVQKCSDKTACTHMMSCSVTFTPLLTGISVTLRS